MFFKGLSIRAKLVLIYSFLIILFVGALNIFSYLGFLNIITEQTLSYSAGIMEQTRNNIDRSIQNVDQASYIVFSNTELLGYLKFAGGTESLDSWQRYNIIKLMTDVMWSVGGYGGDIYSITLYDEDGGYITANPSFIPVPFERLKEPADRVDGRFAWLEKDDTLGIFTVVRKIRDMEMKPQGYLRFDIRLKGILGYFSEELRRLGGSHYILDGDRVLLGDSEGAAERFASYGVDPSILRGGSGYLRLGGRGTDAQVMIYSASRYNDWVYAGVVPLQRLLKSAALLRTMTLGSTLVSVLLFSLLSFLVISQYTKPIHQIAEEMKRVQLRDWLPAIRYTGNDEISYLTEQFSVMARRIGTLVDEVLEEKARYHSQQLDSLLSQINPHFLYNTLEVVNWMSRERRVPEIGDIVVSLSDMMRYSLKRDNGFVPLQEELDYVSQYLRIQKLRFGGKFEAEISCGEDAACVEIPKLILQPLVENSILHGFKSLKRVGLLKVYARLEGDHVVLGVEDNGRGMEQEAADALLRDGNPAGAESHHGIGVGNVNRRIGLLYGPSYGLRFRSAAGAGTVCTIRLPLDRPGIKEAERA